MMRRWERIVRDVWYPDPATRPGHWEMNGRRGEAWDDFLRAQIHMHTSTRKPCSCWICGNPRRYSGEPTVQERRANPNPQVEVEGLEID